MPTPPVHYMTALARDARELAALAQKTPAEVARLGSVASELGELVETLACALATLDLGQECTDRLLAEAQRAVHLAQAQIRSGFATESLVVCTRCGHYDVVPVPSTSTCGLCGGPYVRSRFGTCQ
jgi:hypothetical protein